MKDSGSAFEGGGLVPVEPSTGFDYDAVNERIDAELQEIVDRRVDAEVDKAVWEAVTRFALEVRAHKDPALTVTAFCFAAGLYCLDGKSITELAEEMGVSKQALSDRVVLITKQLGLPPSRGMKSEEAREKYQAAQNERKKSHE